MLKAARISATGLIRSRASLITGKTRTLGVVAGDIQNPFYASVLPRYLQCREAQRLRPADHQTATKHSSKRFIRSSCWRRTGGRTDRHPQRHSQGAAPAQSADHGRPLVLIDRAVAGLMVDRVATDNIAAAEHAVRQLIAAGHRRIAIVAGTRRRRKRWARYIPRPRSGRRPDRDGYALSELASASSAIFGRIRIEGLPVDRA